MDLIEITRIVKDKDSHRNKLLGQKEMLMEGLVDLGFKNLGEADKTAHKFKNELVKMRKHFTIGKEKFQKSFSHLLT